MTPLMIQIDVGGIWRTSIFVGMLIFCFLLQMKFKEQMSLAARALWFYVLASAIYLFEFPSVPFEQYNTAFQATAGATFAEALLIPTVVFMMNANELRWALRAIIGLVIFENIMIWFNGYGLMLAPSFDTALIALVLPLIPRWARFLSLITIFTHHGSTALLIVLAELFAYAMVSKRARRHFLIATPLCLAAAYFHHHGPWLDGLERMQKYKEFMTLWWSRPWSTILFGIGPGSFVWCSMLMDHFKPPLFLQMHSDWLQIAFENGLIGIALVMATIASAIRQAFKRSLSTTWLASIFGCMAFCTTYHPLRFMPTMIIIAIIFRLSFLRPIKGEV